MLSIGGVDPAKPNETLSWQSSDAPNGLAIYDLTALNRTLEYDANAGPYHRPPPLHGFYEKK